jgi:hypothetical protein
LWHRLQNPSSGGKGGPVILGLLVADVCVSSVADTLTLPVIILLAHRGAAKDNHTTYDLPVQYSAGATAMPQPPEEKPAPTEGEDPVDPQTNPPSSNW